MDKIFGIDISAHQGDFPLDVAVSDGVQFVILKAAGGDCGLYKDSKFERNYKLAKQLNLPVGCYFYSKALSVSGAIEEAKFLYENCLKGKKFELPVYYDVEDQTQLSLGKETVTDIITNFCDYIKEKGYVAGIYSSLSHFNNSFVDERLLNYEHWVAQWSKNLSYSKKCGMWQFGGETNLIRSNKVANQVVDQDYMLYDYTKDVKQGEDKITIDQAIDRVISIALNEVGYHEKASNAMLDDKTANSGSGNYTKYARDLDNIPTFYNGKKQGFAYCDIFVDWVFFKAFGYEMAMKMLYQPTYSLGAGCTYSMGYYKSNNAFSKTPSFGGQIFFGNSTESTHTGIVVDVTDYKVTTVEGNTSDGVYKRTYSVNDKSILGYGLPNYNLVLTSGKIDDVVPTPVVTNDSITSVIDVQRFLNNKYLDTFKEKLDEDNEYDKLTKRALVMAVQKELKSNINGKFSDADKRRFPIFKNGKIGILVKLVQCGLICNGFSVGGDGADGIYGKKTISGVKKFQKQQKIVVDGECGPETAYKLFG